MNWKHTLDRYLTDPPDDGFDGWVEKLCEKFDNTFFDANEDWILKSGECGQWMNELFYRKGYSPSKSAPIIQRGFYIYFYGKI